MENDILFFIHDGEISDRFTDVSCQLPTKVRIK